MDAAGLNSCPFCRQAIKRMRLGFGKAICAGCDRTVWFIGDRSAASFFKTPGELDQVIIALEKQGKLTKLGVDSLDLLEMMMELEEHSSRS